MSNPSEFIPIPGSQYSEGVQLEEYNGQISIVAAKEGRDGKVYKKWGFPQGKDKKPLEKAIPWKITLGTKEQAADILKTLYRALVPKPSEQAKTEPVQVVDDDESIPF